LVVEPIEVSDDIHAVGHWRAVITYEHRYLMLAYQACDGLLVIGRQHHTLGFDPFQVQCHAHPGAEGTVFVVIELHRSDPHRVQRE
jgi:hypothetical protein